MRLAISFALVAVLLGACATSPRGSGVRPAPPETPFALTSVDFDEIPGWREADHAPALLAFQRMCEAREQRAPDQPWSSVGRYGGVTANWRSVCALAQSVAPGAERAFFETNFVPHAVSGPGEVRLTAYYEPIIEARRTPDATYASPLLTRPSDMVSVDLAAFAEAYDNEALRGAPRALTGQLNGSQVRPYPPRSEITPADGQVFAYAHPVDLYNLQIQGSGRLAFPDGTQSRAAFAAQNGYRWRSALGALRDSGELPAASWAHFKAWSDQRGAAATQQALNADPSYVFFQEEQIADPAAGPRGAATVPLTPMGSMAVDPAYHPYGAVIFVDGSYDDQPFRRLFVAQDTGGAIRRGPLRGDVFFGSGPEAGQGAERMNAPARWWTLLPRGVPIA